MNLSIFRSKTCVEINDDGRGTYNTNSQINFKNSMLKASLFDCSDACILVKGIISIAPVPPPDKKIVFKNCAPFTDCISETNITPIDDAKGNLIEYSDNYRKISRRSWQYYRDEPIEMLPVVTDKAINDLSK